MTPALAAAQLAPEPTPPSWPPAEPIPPAAPVTTAARPSRAPMLPPQCLRSLGRPPADLRIQRVLRLAALEHAHYLLGGFGLEIHEGLLGVIGGVGGDQAVREADQRVVRWDRLLLEDVQPGPGDPAFSDRPGD